MALVLLVEDNATNRKLLRDILEIKFDVLEAESAEVAAELLQDYTRNKAEDSFAAFRARFLGRYGVESVGDSNESPASSEA